MIDLIIGPFLLIIVLSIYNYFIYQKDNMKFKNITFIWNIFTIIFLYVTLIKKMY